MPSNDFIQTYGPLANDIAGATGMDPSVVLGVIDTETGGGVHVRGNNVFGISPGGQVAAYQDVPAAAQAFVSLMQTPRYSWIPNRTDNPNEQADALVRSGYNTVNPNYAALVSRSAANVRQQLGMNDGQPQPQQGPQQPQSEKQKALSSLPGGNGGGPAPASAAPQSEKDKAIASLPPPPKETEQPPPGPGVPSAEQQSSELGLPLPATPPGQTPPGMAVVGRLGEAAQRGWESTPPVLSPEAENFLNQYGGPVGRYITVPGARIAGGLLGAGAAVGSAVGQGAYELGNALDPALGRDLFMLAQVAPAAAMGAAGGATSPFMTPEAARTIAAAREAAQAPTPAARFGQTGGPTVSLDQLTRAVQEADQSNLPPGAIPTAAQRAAAREAPTTAGAPTFLDGTWLRRAGDVNGAYNMGKGGAALSDAAQQALDQGHTVQLVADEGRRTINITNVRNGVMYDEKGQPWGSMSVATDATGREGLRITPAGGRPQPAGAQVTPAGVAQMTPEEIAAYRGSAEGRKLIENQTIGEPDRNQYIPGITANAAEQEQTVAMARELKDLTNTNVQVSQEAKEAAQRHDTIRRGFLQDLAGDDVTTHLETQAREKDIASAKQTVFAPDNVRGDVSMQPLIDQVKDVMGRLINRENDPLQEVFGNLLKRLTNADGTAKTMAPEQAWGLRQQIDRWTSKRAQADDANLHYVAHDLSNVADTLDGEIEKMAPGYAAMKAEYAAHSGRLNELELLQGQVNNLLSKPALRFSDFQRFMKKVVDARRTPSNDLNPYKSISEDTMNKLWALRDDLRRSASAVDLARAPGSDTVPNIIDYLKKTAKLGGVGAAHAIAGHISPVVGNLAVNAITGALERGAARRAFRGEIRRGREMLYPSNPLTPPGGGSPLSP